MVDNIGKVRYNKNMKTYKLHEFAKLIRVCDKTLDRWDHSGILKAYRLPTGRRFYTEDQYVECMGGAVKPGEEKK